VPACLAWFAAFAAFLKLFFIVSNYSRHSMYHSLLGLHPHTTSGTCFERHSQARIAYLEVSVDFFAIGLRILAQTQAVPKTFY
jgi:hypothetical protein